MVAFRALLSRLTVASLVAGALNFGAVAWAADPEAVKTTAPKAAPKGTAPQSAPAPATEAAVPAPETAAPVANGNLCVTNSCSTQKMLTPKSAVNLDKSGVYPDTSKVDPNAVDLVSEMNIQNLITRFAALGITMSDKDIVEMRRIDREVVANALAAQAGAQ